MRTRILVGVTLALMFLAMMYFGGVVQVVLFSVAATLCVYEIRRVFLAKEIKPFVIPAYFFAVSYYAITKYLGIYWILLLLVFGIMAIIFERIFNQKRTNDDVMAAIFIFIYPLSFFLCMALTDGILSHSLSRTAMLMVFAAPLLGDTFAYFIGVFFGKHKLCPEISPKKTIEGSIGGLPGGILAGLAIFFLQGLWSQGNDLRIVSLLVLGLVCSIVGQAGDLFASTIKRWANIKDFGTLLPGHGGMLDRIDSVLLCAPIVFLYFYGIHSYIR